LDHQYINLTQLQPAQLDMALAAGWFRIQQTLFTTDSLCFDDLIYKAIWLRVCLHDFEPDKTYSSLTKKNRRFRIEFSREFLTPEHERLFADYKKHIPFETAFSLRSLLYGSEEKNVFDTQFMNLYDGNRLIATGGFDLGLESAAGIFSVYDPIYKQFSLGKYLIYEKIKYCKIKGFNWFYPGYVVPGYSRFDYKKEIGKGAIEYFDRERNTWFPLINENFSDQ
jgi:arginine-tRNA-protein transferase